MRVIVAAALAVGLVASAGTAKQDDKKVEKLLRDIEDAAKKAAAEKDEGKKAEHYKAMIKAAEDAEKLDDKNPAVPFALGSAYTALRKNEDAEKAFSKVIALTKDSPVAVAYDRRGDANLKIGKFEDAVKDFDKYHELRKAGDKEKAEHWRRGIALYYAKEYEKGAKQFELHKTVNPEDVENAVWHYLCNAKATNKEKAKKELIAVKDDARVPMKEILELFKDGKPEPAKLVGDLSAKKLEGEAKKEAEFYAYLYCALYFESEGKKEDCETYLKKAVEKKISHYMWDVADIHLKTLTKK